MSSGPQSASHTSRVFALGAIMASAGVAVALQAPVSLSSADVPQFVAQLHRMRDKSAAHTMAGYRLSDRMEMDAELGFEQQLPGRFSRDTFRAFSDDAEFLPPPARIIIPNPAPDPDATIAILAKVKAYVESTHRRLPNLSAQRSTTYLTVATPLLMEEQEQSLQLGMMLRKIPHSNDLGPTRWDAAKDSHLFDSGTWDLAVSYRNDAELHGPASQKGVPGNPPQFGLITAGEFSGAPTMVLADSSQGTLRFDHWERSSFGTLAVFQFDVPRQSSHFEVGVPQTVIPGMPFRPSAAPYHGEFAASLDDGTIYRLTFESADPDGAVGMVAKNVVIYAPVLIGGTKYVCPVRSAAISKVYVARNVRPDTPYIIYMNHSEFTHYRLFRSDWRLIVPDETAAP